MPPKIRISKEKIADTAFKLVQERGMNALSAKNLAKALDCSTQPLFWWYENMDGIKDVVEKRAKEMFVGYLKEQVEGVNPYKAIGLNYIRFAKEQKQLFKVLFMSESQGDDTLSIIEEMPFILDALNSESLLSRETALRVLKEMWLFAHGIATMVATDTAQFDPIDVKEMLTATFKGLLMYYTEDVAQTKINEQ